MIKGVVRLVLGGNMKLKRLAALALAGVLCLSAFTGCGAKSSDAVATLGDETVTYGVANFIMKYQKASVDDMYALYASYYGVDSMWDIDVSGGGTTLEEDFKASALELLHEMYVLKAHMADYNVEITEEENAAISEAVTAFLAANTEEALEEFGATEEIVTEVLTLYTIQAKMYDAIIADTDREVSDEEANMRGYSMLAISLEGEYDEDYSWVDYTDEEIEEIKSNVLQMGLDLNTMTLEEVAEQYGYEVTTGAYAAEDTSLEADVLVALDALNEGQVSDAVETDTAIYFVRIDAETDEEATEENRQSIIAEREYALYEEVVTGWMEDDGWTVNDSVVDKIDFHNIFTQVQQSTESESDDSTENTEVSETVDGTESE